MWGLKLRWRRAAGPAEAMYAEAVKRIEESSSQSWLKGLFRKRPLARDRWWQGALLAAEVESQGRRLEGLSYEDLLGLNGLELTRELNGEVLRLFVEVEREPSGNLRVWVNADESTLAEGEAPPSYTFGKRPNGELSL